MHILFTTTVLLLTLVICNCQDTTAISTNGLDSTVLDTTEASTDVDHSVPAVTSTNENSFSNITELSENPTIESSTANVPTDDKATDMTNFITSITSTTSTISTTSAAITTLATNITSVTTTVSITTSTTSEIPIEPSSSTTNLGLILGLTLGLGIPVLIAVSVGIIWYCKRGNAKTDRV
ncbi:unnamed protein product [Rotaria sp. Silwood1]|nr:unnamed protein product [Rotaria sp. Silwood1]CAF3435649.1 unnamed protein product [Rotaria sp. Silwood1]CAF3456495.1 unnamed protein product [Rotaria sp. Silwood1]CAF4589934.1 unnamed protein product [Rotaria sp. Silwood1]CAF4598033.1 unnamed protein product [Rotaria sp. Silwood1]